MNMTALRTIGLTLLSAVLSLSAYAASPIHDWLHEIQNAAKELDYAGILSYSNSEGMQSMQLVHLVDGTGEHERLETLDGVTREYIRVNDVTQCLIPDKRLVIVEKAFDGRFPSLLVGDSSQIDNFYTLTKKNTERIAGRECQMYQLTPKDQLRYGYNFCIDTTHQLLLKSQTITSSDQPAIINQVSFVTLQLGEKVPVQSLPSSWKYQDWKVVAANIEPTSLSDQGWRIPYPKGFSPVSEVTRYIRTERQVAQLVLSDGLASISIFIEPVDVYSSRLKADPGSKKGSIHLYRKRIGDFWLTTTGEVPLETLHYLGNNTEFVPSRK